MPTTKDDDTTERADFSDSLIEANAAADKGPLSALLTPAFEVFGKRLGKLAERMVGERRKNIQEHGESVAKKNPDIGKREPTLRDVRLIRDWYEEAQEVGSDERDMASVWRAVLDEIFNKPSEAEALIKIAKGLSKRDLEIMDRLRREVWVIEDNYNRSDFDVLARAGLVRRVPAAMEKALLVALGRIVRWTPVVVAVGLLVGIALSASSSSRYVFELIGSDNEVRSGLIVLGMVIVCLGVFSIQVFVSAIVASTPGFMLTSLGKRFVQKISDYRSSIDERR